MKSPEQQIVIAIPPPKRHVSHSKGNRSLTHDSRQDPESNSPNALPCIESKYHIARRALRTAKPQLEAEPTNLDYLNRQNRPSLIIDAWKPEFARSYGDKFCAAESPGRSWSSRARGSRQELRKEQMALCENFIPGNDLVSKGHTARGENVRQVSQSPEVPQCTESRSCGGRRKINYQKGGGGGAFKRKPGYTVPSPSVPRNKEGEGNGGGLYSISSYTRFLKKPEDKSPSPPPIPEPAQKNTLHDPPLMPPPESVFGTNWSAFAREVGSHMPKYAINAKFSKPMAERGKRLSQAKTVGGPEKSRPKKTVREMKRQILLELMEINSIPASYFILGRDAARQALSVGIEDVIDLVEVSTNENGDIVIRPREGIVSRKIALKEAKNGIAAMDEGGDNCKEGDVECGHSIMIRRMQIVKQQKGGSRVKGDRAKSKDASASHSNKDYLSPRRHHDSKRASPPRELVPVPPAAGMHRRLATRSVTRQPAGKIAMVKLRQKKSSPQSPRQILVKPPITAIATKIKIYHETDEHLAEHPINVTIRLLNEFSAACFKPKLDAAINKELVLTLGRKLGLSISRSQLNHPDFLKNKELMNALKEKLLRTLFVTLNRENDITPEQIYSTGYCRAYVANGNNPMMVKSVLKQRWWWTTVDSSENAHLVWTQWKKIQFIESLPSVTPQPVTAQPNSSSVALLTSSSTDLSENEDSGAKKQPVSSHGSNNKSIGGGTEASGPGSSKAPTRMCNHVEGNVHLGNKKGLFYNMKSYYESLGKDPFLAIPLTFHIQHGLSDPQFDKFSEVFLKIESESVIRSEDQNGKCENVWIVKPGENTNRGNGISMHKTLAEIKRIVSDGEKAKHTYIIQKYIEHPLLVNKRKFDIRCYGLVTAYNGHVKGYFYKEGYLRTASREFTLKSLAAKIVHLTNEAVQQKYDDFGKFEPGNKMTYADLNKYIEANHAELHVDFYQHILPQIKRLVTDSIRATHGKLDPNGRQQTFELFGYDFMIDSEFHVFLIEANINPCLEIKSPVTARIVPAMLDSALRIAVDPIFQPLHEICGKKNAVADILPEIKHELIYDSKCDGPELQELGKHREHVIIEMDDEEEEEEESGVAEEGLASNKIS